MASAGLLLPGGSAVVGQAVVVTIREVGFDNDTAFGIANVSKPTAD